MEGRWRPGSSPGDLPNHGGHFDGETLRRVRPPMASRWSAGGKAVTLVLGTSARKSVRVRFPRRPQNRVRDGTVVMHGSGPCDRKVVGVRFPPGALLSVNAVSIPNRHRENHDLLILDACQDPIVSGPVTPDPSELIAA